MNIDIEKIQNIINIFKENNENIDVKASILKNINTHEDGYLYLKFIYKLNEWLNKYDDDFKQALIPYVLKPFNLKQLNIVYNYLQCYSNKKWKELLILLKSIIFIDLAGIFFDFSRKYSIYYKPILISLINDDLTHYGTNSKLIDILIEIKSSDSEYFQVDFSTFDVESKFNDIGDVLEYMLESRYDTKRLNDLVFAYILSLD